MERRALNIVFVGPAHPYRGGLASIMESMAREFQSRGCDVRMKTFTLQYPSILFPGKSQIVTTPPPADLAISRCLSTINPVSWCRLGRALRKERPDIVIMKYWTPFMAPAFGCVARLARKNGHTKVICQIDNVQPHEHHIVDKPLNRYFLRSVDGFIYMSEQVHRELREYSSVPALYSPHPLFDNFGSKIARDEACRNLGIDPKCRYALFFGLIRDYKGLDTLIEAWSHFRRAGHKLIIAGEFYTSREKYVEQIARLGLAEDIILHDFFIPDSDVRNYFSAADCVVLPYKSATQSGVTQIAYNFCTPIIVTNVGGLAEIVPDDRVGYVVEPSAAALAEALERIYDGDNIARFEDNMIEERKRFTWSAMCDRIEELYDIL